MRGLFLFWTGRLGSDRKTLDGFSSCSCPWSRCPYSDLQSCDIFGNLFKGFVVNSCNRQRREHGCFYVWLCKGWRGSFFNVSARFCLVFNGLIRNNVSAPEEWPLFTVELKGRAKTYDEALKKLTRLESEDHVLTLESEESASEVQRKMNKAVKRQKLLHEADNIRDMLLGQNVNFIDSTLTKEDQKVMRKEKNKCIDNQPSDEMTDPLQIEQVPNLTIAKKTCTVDSILKSEDHVIKVKSSIDSNNSENLLQPSSSTSSYMESDYGDSTLQNSSIEIAVENHNKVTEQALINKANILHLESVECKSDYESASLSQLIHLTNVVYAMKNKLDEMVNYLTDKKILTKSASNLEKKYNLIIPINTLQAFNELENKLKVDTFLKNDIYVKLCSCMDKDYVITRSYVNMLKAFITKDLALHLTSVRSSTVNKDKIKFKPTELSKLIDVSITNSRSKNGLKTSPEQLITALSHVLGNVVKWKK